MSIVPKSQTSPGETRRRTIPSFGLKTLFVIVAVSSCIVGWRLYQYERGTVNKWIEDTLAANESNPILDNQSERSVIPCPADVSEDEQIRLLFKSLNWLPDRKRRHCVLKILAEQFPHRAHAIFKRVAPVSYTHLTLPTKA